MSYFQVLLEGENFFAYFDGKEELLGFVTTRRVKANNEKQAESKAVELIKNDTSLQNFLRTPESKSLSSKIYLTEIHKVNWLTFALRSPGSGYSFYPMEKE